LGDLRDVLNPILPSSGDSDTGCSAADSALPHSDDTELCKGIVAELYKELNAFYNIKLYENLFEIFFQMLIFSGFCRNNNVHKIKTHTLS
jgi:hypothetical protein